MMSIRVKGIVLPLSLVRQGAGKQLRNVFIKILGLIIYAEQKRNEVSVSRMDPTSTRFALYSRASFDSILYRSNDTDTFVYWTT